MITTILFDFGGVIEIDSSDLWTFCYEDVKSKTGLTIKTLNKLLWKHWPSLSHGKYDLDVLWNEIRTLSQNKMTLQEFRQGLYNSLKIDPQMISLVRNLKKKGYRVAILSNESNQGMANKIKKFKLKKLFHTIYCSAWINMAKPEARIYRHVLKKEGIKPENAVFIDDQMKNVSAAKKLGIKSIYFKNARRFKEDLNKALRQE